MTAKEILSQLKEMGSESTRKILEKHGAPSSQYGVKVEDMKKIQKKVKKNYELSMQLYDTGIPDAQYLAGLIADETRMTKNDLQRWAENFLRCDPQIIQRSDPHRFLQQQLIPGINI